jgi:heterodisulfide reductase subunit B
MNVGYYPGCALHGSSNDYEQSIRACLQALGVTLEEIDEWICCGATAAHSLNHKLAVALPARNLALAHTQGMAGMLAPCPMCSMQLLRAQQAMEHDPELRSEIGRIVEADASGTPRVLNMIQVFERIGLETLKTAVKRPLKDLKPACYYGCLLVRPPSVVEFDDAEQPQSMEAVLTTVGAKPVAWGAKTECCGAGMTLSNAETVIELSGRILANAVAHGANCLVVACPMCHVNLDMKQPDIERATGSKFGLPVYYLTDAVGMALGLSAAELVVERVGVEGAQGVLIVSGHKNRPRHAPDADAADHFEPVHLRHLDIQKDEVGLLRQDGGGRGLAVARFAHNLNIGMALEKPANALPGQRLVVDNQRPDAHRAASPTSPYLPAAAGRSGTDIETTTPRG